MYARLARRHRVYSQALQLRRRSGILHALRHALGELLQLAPGVSYHAYGIQRPLGRSPRIGAWKPLEPREVGDGLQRRLPFIQAAFLWQIADLIEHAADSWLPQYL